VKVQRLREFLRRRVVARRAGKVHQHARHKLRRRLAREGQRDDFAGLDAMCEQREDAVGEPVGFSRSRRSEDDAVRDFHREAFATNFP
jgi:hypothetical protein